MPRGPKPALKAPESPQQAPCWTVPPHLSPEASREWERLYGLLDAQGKIPQVDPTLLEIYAINHELMVRASDDVARNGIVLISANGAIRANPSADVVNRASMRLATIIAELGLSPRSTKEPPASPTSDPASEQWQDLPL